MDLSDIKDLTDEQKDAITKKYDSDVSGLKKNHDELLRGVKKNQEKQTRADKMQSASSLEEMKGLLKEQDEKSQQLEQRILDDEKKRVDVENSHTIATFVNKFIDANVVNDSLVRDAINTKISTRLSVRDGKIVEFNGSELTGKTGDQVLSEIKADKGYSNHLVANNSTGGGATGGGGVSRLESSVGRDQFEVMPHSERVNFYKNGGVVVN